MKKMKDETRVKIRNEVNAWRDMFDMMAEKFNISKAELNQSRYREMFAMIERWAYYDTIRRDGLREEVNPHADDFGTFWEGENFNRDGEPKAQEVSDAREKR